MKQQAFYGFIGRYTTDNMGGSANPFTSDYENNYVVGGAFSQHLLVLGRGLVSSWELGLAARTGERFSGEIWLGLNIRHKGVGIMGKFFFHPGITFGLSLVDRAIGMEYDREQFHGGNSGLLFYLGPELAFASVRRPCWELVYRLHHRSGADQTLGNLMEGHNANTIGVRRRF